MPPHAELFQSIACNKTVLCMPGNTVYGGTFFSKFPVVSSKYIPPPPRAFVIKGSYNFSLKSSAKVTLSQAYFLC